MNPFPSLAPPALAQLGRDPSALAALQMPPQLSSLPAAAGAGGAAYPAAGHFAPELSCQLSGAASENSFQLLSQLLQGGLGSLQGMRQVSQQQHVPAAAADPASRSLGASRPTRSSDTRGTTTYASRHQKAEARRRSRINERLEALRRIVPHTERANTATFLDDVLTYVQQLQNRVVEMEVQLGLPPSIQPPSAQPARFSGTDSEAGEGEPTMYTGRGQLEVLAVQSLLHHSQQMHDAARAGGGPAAAAGVKKESPLQQLPTSSEERILAEELRGPSVSPGAAAGTMADSWLPRLAAVRKRSSSDLANNAPADELAEQRRHSPAAESPDPLAQQNGVKQGRQQGQAREDASDPLLAEQPTQSAEQPQKRARVEQA